MDISGLKARKKELRMTNEELANLSGVSLGTINKIFSGATKSPKYDTMCALSAVLEVPLIMDVSEADQVSEEALTYGKRQGNYTVRDYDALPDRVRAELLEGNLYVMESPSGNHQTVVAELSYYLMDYIKRERGVCKVYVSPMDVCLNQDDRTMLQPDLMVLCDKSRMNGRYVDGAPDFLVEVVSEGSRRRDYRQKMTLYMNAGVREYWIVDLMKERVTVYRFDEEDTDISVYTFQDQIPVGIYGGDLAIDFSKIKAELGLS